MEATATAARRVQPCVLARGAQYLQHFFPLPSVDSRATLVSNVVKKKLSRACHLLPQLLKRSMHSPNSTASGYCRKNGASGSTPKSGVSETRHLSFSPLALHIRNSHRASPAWPCS